MLDAQEVTKQGPKLEVENRLPVADDGVGKIVMLHQHVDNDFCKAWSIDGDFNWLVMYHLSQAIDKNKN